MGLSSIMERSGFLSGSGSLQGMQLDAPLLGGVLALLAIGLVMIGSASVGIGEKLVGDSTYFLVRQLLYVTLGLIAAAMVWRIPLESWQRTAPIWLFLSFVLLLLLFVPGLGKSVNGSTRWIGFGPFNLQVSELVKLALILYLSSYLVRRGEEVRSSVAGFLKPMAVVALFAAVLLKQPDFGATVVLAATALGMMFLGGVRLWLFGVLVAMAASGLALLALTSPYRMERLTAFLNPWADPFNSGFQLTQALIAFGRGEWFGVGLGSSVQKLFYLPEAHTDFVFAVLAEELGMAGASLVIALFALVVGRMFWIGRQAMRSGNLFGGYLSFGIALWIALQAFINMGVNMGLLPTKGLTLPLMSYGGSSMIVICGAVGMVLRVAAESRPRGVRARGRR